jgi:hypothetical protein
MVTAGVRSTGLLALTAASGEIHNAWATFGRVTGAKEAEANFRMTDNLPFAYLRSTLRRQGGSDLRLLMRRNATLKKLLLSFAS